jgi:uncharacterized protein YggE
MMKSLLFVALAFAMLMLAPRAVSAQPNMSMQMMHMPAQISVVANGTVEYVPDTARVTLGIRAESPSAATAVDTINKGAAQVIAAVKAVGISERSIKTVGYNLQYRERPNPPPPMPINAPSAATLPGNYEASEIILVSAPVRVVGKVLDAAINAGANESFGLSYETNNFDNLYRSALAKAVASARSTADAIAKAAHVTIVGVQSISNSSEAQPRVGGMQLMARGVDGAAVMPGTDVVTATAYVVYRIK